VDLSPIQPAFIPPNCRFVIDDVEDDWLYPYNHFDFIHLRCLSGSIKDWNRLYRQAYQRLKPGSWIQHLETSMPLTSSDMSIDGDHIMRRWSEVLGNCGNEIGKTFRVVDQAAERMRAAGFEDVQERWYKVPVGPWSNELVCPILHQLIDLRLAKADTNPIGSANTRFSKPPLL